MDLQHFSCDRILTSQSKYRATQKEQSNFIPMKKERYFNENMTTWKMNGQTCQIYKYFFTVKTTYYKILKIRLMTISKEEVWSRSRLLPYLTQNIPYKNLKKKKKNHSLRTCMRKELKR